MCNTQILKPIHLLTSFFLNNNLLIPPVHPFPILRMLLWFGFGSIVFREGYEDSRTWGTPERRSNPVEGRFRWMLCGALGTEVMLCYKYRKNTGHLNEDAWRDTPMYIWGPWTVWALSMLTWWLYLRCIRSERTSMHGDSDDADLVSKKKDSIKIKE